jgi:hypothetical protein
MKETKVGFYVGELQTQHSLSLSLSVSLCFRISDWLQQLHTHKSWMSKKLDSGAAHPKKRRRR